VTARGDWLQTWSGRAFHVLDPKPAEVWVPDIAHALSQLCRYGGHTKRFYSVAEHCVHVSRAVPPIDALWALFHDASEAYLGDVVRPLKHAGPLVGYRDVEARVQAAICSALLLSAEEPASVGRADKAILYDERKALMADPPLPWALGETGPGVGAAIEGWPPERAEAEFLARYRHLRTGTIYVAARDPAGAWVVARAETPVQRLTVERAGA
jgi:uncharacterized protein